MSVIKCFVSVMPEANTNLEIKMFVVYSVATAWQACSLPYTVYLFRLVLYIIMHLGPGVQVGARFLFAYFQ